MLYKDRQKQLQKTGRSSFANEPACPKCGDMLALYRKIGMIEKFECMGCHTRYEQGLGTNGLRKI